MPIYEYKCEDCGLMFEHLARSFSEAKPNCPKCNSTNVSKEISTFSSHIASACDSCVSQERCGGHTHSHSKGCGCGCCG